MNPIIQKNQNMQNQNPQANAANNDTQLNQCFASLPKFVQENIKQSGVTFSNVQEMQQVANQMTKQSGQQ